MQGYFRCKACGKRASDDLTIHSSKDPTVALPECRDQQPICERGVAYKSYEPLDRAPSPHNPAPLDFIPQYWMNPGDVAAFAKHSKKRGRLGGCCGIAGMSGPNMICSGCKTEIGTKQSDCFTPLIFVPHPDNMEFIRQD